MRVAQLDTFAGISGDMFLAALLDAGAPLEVLESTLSRLNLGARLEVRKLSRSGIQATKVDVMVGHALADLAPAHAHAGNGHSHHPNRNHAEHVHTFENHSEHRSFTSIGELILEADLPESVAKLALNIFEELARAESKVHGIPIDAVHFHEVGAIDAIADIVLAAAGIDALEIDQWLCSSLNVGGGTVQCAHGRFPVPSPATAELLRGLPTYSSGIQMELITPTGAAIIRTLNCQFDSPAIMRVDRIGYGAGSRDPEGFANVLRISIGETEAPPSAPCEVITVIETAVDDMNPQIIAYVAEKALSLGAIDVMCLPVQMKKGRQGTLITLLCASDRATIFQDLLLRETTSLGLRVREEKRVCLSREIIRAVTSWGPVGIKVARRDGVEWNAAPEYEDCRALAQKYSVPLKDVMAAALQAHRTRDSS